MAEKNKVTEELSLSVGNCVSRNIDLHPTEYAWVFVDGSEKSIDIPNNKYSESMTINFDK